MVSKKTCSHCKGNRQIPVVKSDGKDGWAKCPSCGGQGYTIHMTR